MISAWNLTVTFFYLCESYILFKCGTVIMLWMIDLLSICHNSFIFYLRCSTIIILFFNYSVWIVSWLTNKFKGYVLNVGIESALSFLTICHSISSIKHNYCNLIFFQVKGVWNILVKLNPLVFLCYTILTQKSEPYFKFTFC